MSRKEPTPPPVVEGPMVVAVPEGLMCLGSGVITLAHWTMCSDGETYLYAWSEDWRIITDSQVPAEKFRSTEKWSLISVVDGEANMVIPGCQVKGLVRGDCPERTGIFRT